MVSNPRSAYNMIEFGNDMKKSGLYVLGHVITEPFGPDVSKHPLSNKRCEYFAQMAESFNESLNTWLTFVTISKMKAFVELIPAPSIRAGTQTLLAVSRQQFPVIMHSAPNSAARAQCMYCMCVSKTR